MNFVKLTLISLCMVFVGIAQADEAPLTLGISIGSALINPQALAEDNYENGIVFGISIDVPWKRSWGLVVGLAYNEYPFVKKHFSDLPCVPYAGRVGENGDHSRQFAVDATVNYLGKKNEARLLMAPYFGFGLGLLSYYEGERRWKKWDSINQVAYDWIVPASWKPLILTVNAVINMNVIRWEKFLLAGCAMSRFRLLGKMKVDEYSPWLVDVTLLLGLKYKL